MHLPDGHLLRSRDHLQVSLSFSKLMDFCGFVVMDPALEAREIDSMAHGKFESQVHECRGQIACIFLLYVFFLS